jgi:uncharacterized membrane protein
MTRTYRALLVTSLAGALAVPGLVAYTSAKGQSKTSEVAHCYDVNKCKGVGDCGGPGNSCAGKNSCRRQGFIDMGKDTCLRLDGGRLTPNPESSGN